MLHKIGTTFFTEESCDFGAAYRGSKKLRPLPDVPKKLNSANHLMSLQADSSPVKPQMRPQP